MKNKGFEKIYWGFLFILLSFRIQGIDILPDVVGYILFAIGLRELTSYSDYFRKAGKYNIPMIILSIFSIYQPQSTTEVINFGIFGVYTIPIAIAGLILNLLIVYNILMGISEMKAHRGRHELANQAMFLWRLYLVYQMAVSFGFILVFIPGLGILGFAALFVMGIILVVKIMEFIKMCDE